MSELLPILAIFDKPPQEMLLWVIALALPTLPNLWCIWHAYRHEFTSPIEKFAWMGAGVFLPLVGGLSYLLIGCRRTQGLADWAKPRRTGL